MIRQYSFYNFSSEDKSEMRNYLRSHFSEEGFRWWDDTIIDNQYLSVYRVSIDLMEYEENRLTHFLLKYR